MDNELERIRKHNRRIMITLVLLAILILTGIVLNAWKKPPVVHNYIGQEGQRGDDGQSIQGPRGYDGYTPIKGVDYTDGAKGDKGDSVVGPQGPMGQTSTVPGPQGDMGPQGPSGPPLEERCNPNNHNDEWRVVGEDGWHVKQQNSLACQEAL